MEFNYLLFITHHCFSFAEWLASRTVHVVCCLMCCLILYVFALRFTYAAQTIVFSAFRKFLKQQLCNSEVSFSALA